VIKGKIDTYLELVQVWVGRVEAVCVGERQTYTELACVLVCVCLYVCVCVCVCVCVYRLRLRACKRYIDRKS